MKKYNSCFYLIRIATFAILILTFASFIQAQTMLPGADARIWQRALQIQRKAIVIDTHNDITTAMYDEDADLGTSLIGKFHTDGDISNPSFTPYHTDLARMKTGGLTAEFFSIYISGDYAKAGGSTSRAINQIDSVYRAAEKYPNDLVMAYSTADIRRAKKQGTIAALMGLEGGHAIEDSLATLREFYRLGVRYMTLTHNNNNNWADSSRSAPIHNGLTDFGREVVKEMNRLGMLIDVSHVSDKTMADVLDISTAPVIASHSSAQHFSSHPRNVSDDLIKRIAKNGGVVQINFYPAFLDQRSWDEDKARDVKLKTELDALNQQYKDDPRGLSEAKRILYAANPIYNPPYTRIVDHIDYIKNLVGIDYVGIGSDFDGVPGLPEGMSGVEDLPLVTYEMLKRGYSESDIRKVLGENLLRVFAQAEKVAIIQSRQISGEGSLRRITK
ncbi:MAG: dipeptidase [Pyrinomonadaceae bacterium]